MRLLVGVERGIADAVRQALERDGHQVVLAYSGSQAVEMAKARPFDAIVVDVALPIDGFEAARVLRRAGILTPILMLIAKDAARDVSRVASAGADDFLMKPFMLVELAARVNALLGRRPARDSTRLQLADLTLDTATHEVTRGGAPVRLTRKEYLLLELLLKKAGRVVSRQDLIAALWKNEAVAGNTLDAFVRLLRNKIDRGRPVKLIHTVRGFGYRLSNAPKERPTGSPS